MPEDNKLSPCYLIPDHPIKALTDEEDSFQFKPFVDTFVSLAMTKHNETPFTVVIDGPWGSGKTTLMEMTKSVLDERAKNFKKLSPEEKDYLRPCKTLWFNAWQYSSDEHILTAFLLTIFKELQKEKSLWEKAKDVRIEEFLNGPLKKFTGADLSGFFKDSNHLLNNSIFLDEFKFTLNSLIGNYCFGNEKDETLVKGPVVIFIDDLDRCPPDRVLQVLEAIKLFLDTRGCIFFLGMDVDRVRQAVSNQFGGQSNFKPAQFMEKIIQIRARIPPVAELNMERYFEEIIKKFKDREGFMEKFDKDVKNVFLAAGFKTQRALKRALNDYLFLETLCENMPDINFVKPKKE